ncbi:MAG: class I SAM-dependent methyltransferase [Puniceicoccales bacterium]|jgi:ubiquinone/menaquinone biosynthesis C-methylase UbiE|nr:class I SAM-dependent methyltransferase [Puniceicoccales bacterium]
MPSHKRNTTHTPPTISTLSNIPYFTHEAIVLHYARAAVTVGLWESERILCDRYFPQDAPLLELGCGAGRIAFGLWENGWRDITATDFSARMIEAAREINRTRRSGIVFSVADATALPFPSEHFTSVIFGFNGLMMIPGATRREQALREMRRVLRPGGTVIFTGHERDLPCRQTHWARERDLWARGLQDPSLEQFGDYNHSTPQGRMFIHASSQEEVRTLAKKCGFFVAETAMRSELASEPLRVRDFSDDTRFWVLRPL